MSAADLIHAYAQITPEHRGHVAYMLQQMLTPAGGDQP
jgi:hypothetical protein